MYTDLDLPGSYSGIIHLGFCYFVIKIWVWRQVCNKHFSLTSFQHYMWNYVISLVYHHCLLFLSFLWLAVFLTGSVFSCPSSCLCMFCFSVYLSVCLLMGLSVWCCLSIFSNVNIIWPCAVCSSLWTPMIWTIDNVQYITIIQWMQCNTDSSKLNYCNSLLIGFTKKGREVCISYRWFKAVFLPGP